MGTASQLCRLSGFDYGEPPWGADGRTPLFEHRSCCGVLFGYEDSRPEGIKQYRDRWISDGAKWSHPAAKPDDWDLQGQLRAAGLDQPEP